MPNNNPPVIEKILVDVDLSGGLDEDHREEKVDWTKNFVQLENGIYQDESALVCRDGLNSFLSHAGNVSAEGISTAAGRLVALDDGVGVVGTNHGSDHGIFFQTNEGSAQITAKSYASEFSVRNVNTISGSPGIGAVKSVALLNNYKCMVHYVSSPTAAYPHAYAIIICDRYSGNIVRTYYLYYTTNGDKYGPVMVGVSGRYLHFYESGNGVAPTFWQLDTQNLPADLTGISKTNLNGSTNAYFVVGAFADGANSVVCYTDGTTVTKAEKFSTGGVSVANSGAGYAGAPNAYDAGTDGTFYYVGSTKVNTSLVFQGNIIGAASPMTGFTKTRARYVIRTGGGGFILYHGSYTSTGGATIPCTLVYSFTGAFAVTTFAGYMVGWCEASLPWYNAANNKCYVAMTKMVMNANGATLSKDVVGGSASIICLEATSTTLPYTFRCSAVVDAYAASIDKISNGCSDFEVPPRPSSIDGGFTTVLGNANKPSLTWTSYDLVELGLSDMSTVHCATDVLSGGVVQSYDGQMLSESGFVEVPIPMLRSGALSGASTLAAGNYNVIVVWDFVDAKGRVHYSRCSRVVTYVSAGAGSFQLECSVPTVTQHRLPYLNGLASTTTIRQRIYMTQVGGTQYFLLSTIQAVNVGTGGITQPLVETTTSTPIGTQPTGSEPILYRQPGTVGTALDRYHGLAFNHIIRHKDRVFGCRGTTIWYSTFSVDGEIEWYNPAFSINVPGGQGDIVGLGSMDGTLVAFKRNAIFFIDGDGPPENGGTGQEFSPPRKLATEYGCIDARTLVDTPDGIMFRSNRGFELLRRNGSVEWVGIKVNQTATANPYSGGACHDRKNSFVYFPVGTAIDGYKRLSNTGTGVTLVWDAVKKTWETARYNMAGGYGKPIMEYVYGRVAVSGDNSDRVLASDSSGYVSAIGPGKQDEWVSGSPNLVPITIQTGWVKSNSVQDRIKVTDILLSYKWLGNHKIRVSYATDYNPGFTLIGEFNNASTSSQNILNWNVPKESVQAIKFKIETLADGVAQSAGQLTLFGITVKLGQKSGGAKVSAGQKV